MSIVVAATATATSPPLLASSASSTAGEGSRAMWPGSRWSGRCSRRQVAVSVPGLLLCSFAFRGSCRCLAPASSPAAGFTSKSSP
jgi:hypothetical protein